jgi:Family of unknown function (DUF6174)
MKAKVEVLVILLVSIIISGCQSTKETIAINQSEKKWLDQKIQNYRIEVHYYTLGTEVFTTILVRNGKVVDVKCSVGTMFTNGDILDQCAYFLQNPEFLAVPGLFDSARSLVSDVNNLNDEMKANAISISFDPQYGFPNRMAWNPPEPTEWEVLSFKVNP